MSSYIPPYGYRHIEINGKKDKLLRKYIDSNVLKDYERFVQKVNERTLYQKGIIKEYNNSGDPALGLEVEYFHPSITADDRMLYIMENIVSVPHLDWRNVIGNTTISHFYGARGVHSVLTGIEDPKKAHIDFVKLGKEQIDFKNTGEIGEYTKKIRDLAISAQKNKKSIWGTTELHTSIQTAGRRFVNEWYLGQRRHENKGCWSNVSEWIASWTHLPALNNSEKTVMEGIRDSKNLEETFKYLTGEQHIGEYYGYHCSTSNSVNPKLSFDHDSTFVAPGPGARETLDKMFPNLTKRQVSYGDRVVWIRENQHEILNVGFDKSLWNYTNSFGVKIFKDPQNELKSYGTEVSLCQYAVYCRLRSNPELISRRKVARAEDSKPKKILKEKESKKKDKEKNMKFIGEAMQTIIDVFMKKKESEKVPDVETSKSALKQKPASLTSKEKIEKIVKEEDKIKDNTSNFSTSFKEKIVLESINRIGTPCTHNQVLKDIESREMNQYFDLRTNWKETWKVMKDLTEKNVLEKDERYYTFKD